MKIGNQGCFKLPFFSLFPGTVSRTQQRFPTGRIVCGMASKLIARLPAQLFRALKTRKRDASVWKRLF